MPRAAPGMAARVGVAPKPVLAPGMSSSLARRPTCRLGLAPGGPVPFATRSLRKTVFIVSLSPK